MSHSPVHPPRRPTILGALAAAAILGSFALVLPSAHAQAYGDRSAFNPRDCSRDCLSGFARQYMQALVHHDPSHVPFAARVKFTENDVLIPIGSGLWRSISSASSSPLLATDPDTGNVAWFGTIEEHGAPAYYAMRLKVRENRIEEIETVVDRKTELPAPFGDPAKLVHDPAFGEVLPPTLRRERERLRDVANGYFSTVERNDGDLLTLFDSGCERTENGISTTSGHYGSAALAQGCEAQFKLGAFRINKRVRERRYPLIDVERGVVVATGFFDHDNSFDRYTTTDGKERRTLLKWPNSLSLMEAFKIRGGRIYRVEAVFTYVPYFMHSPWEPDLKADSADAEFAEGDAADTDSDGSQARAAACDRACLIDFADRYMNALVAHDPSRLVWAKIVRYTENSVPMNVGEGQWSTVTSKSEDPIEVADPTTGSVAWLGSVKEHGDPAYYAMRLKVRNRRISEAEVLVDPHVGPGRLGDPARNLHDPAFKEVLAAGARSSRPALIAVAERSLAADPELAGDRLRGASFSIVDTDRGVVVATAFIDHAADYGQGVGTTPFNTSYPQTLGLVEALKIRQGRVERAETISTSLPYAMPSPWVRELASR